jgi:hypothetical protein
MLWRKYGECGGRDSVVAKYATVAFNGVSGEYPAFSMGKKCPYCRTNLSEKPTGSRNHSWHEKALPFLGGSGLYWTRFFHDFWGDYLRKIRVFLTKVTVARLTRRIS